MAEILCIGMDDASMQAKQLVLQGAGHSVSLAKDIRKVVAACSGIRFDVILIGQSLPDKEKLRVYELLQQHGAGARIVEQHVGAPVLTAADAHIRASESNKKLTAIIEDLIGRRQSA